MKLDGHNAKCAFITFEGGDGTGKSTQADMLSSRMEEHGMRVCRVHEPGGTNLGEKIRNLLLSREMDDMDPLAELLLYEAARAQVMTQVIIPALERGECVICDRFTDSTLAYQGYGRELGAELVDRINKLSTKGYEPDRTILLTLDDEAAQKRVVDRSADGSGDRMESAGRAFRERMLAGFAEIAAASGGRVRVVNAKGSVEEVHARVMAELSDLPGFSGAIV